MLDEPLNYCQLRTRQHELECTINFEDDVYGITSQQNMKLLYIRLECANQSLLNCLLNIITQNLPNPNLQRGLFPNLPNYIQYICKALSIASGVSSAQPSLSHLINHLFLLPEWL